jgi:hypothetical protein
MTRTYRLLSIDPSPPYLKIKATRNSLLVAFLYRRLNLSGVLQSHPAAYGDRSVMLSHNPKFG